MRWLLLSIFFGRISMLSGFFSRRWFMKYLGAAGVAASADGPMNAIAQDGSAKDKLFNDADDGFGQLPRPRAALSHRQLSLLRLRISLAAQLRYCIPAAPVRGSGQWLR